MTQTYNIGGSSSPLKSLFKTVIAAAAVIGGLFLMAASAAVAFFLILGLVILVSLIVAFLWGKAKLTGKPFGPKAYFKAQGFDLEKGFDLDAAAQMQQRSSSPKNSPEKQSKHGPIIDAHKTPEGWSVDD